MPRNPGTGVYSKPSPDVITGTTIESTVYNTFVGDVETDLNTPRPISAGGTGGTDAATAATNLKAVSYGNAQTLTDAEKLVARTNIAATPLDALAYNGMQVNGSMEVSQELGNTGTLINLKYGLDGFALFFGGTAGVTLSSQPLSITPGLNSILIISVQTAQVSMGASDYVMVQQCIEGYRISRLGWGTASAKPITLGFWTAHHRPGVYGGVIRNSAFDRVYPFSYTQNVADINEYKTIIIPGDTTGTWLTTNGIGLRLGFSVAAGSSQIAPSSGAWLAGSFLASPGQVNAVGTTADVFRLTGLTVLPGTQAPTAAQSPLIMRPYDQELVTCQRYFYNGVPPLHGNVDASGLFVPRVKCSHPVIMRAVPTVSLTANLPVFDGPTATTIVSVTASYATTKVLEFGANLAAALVANRNCSTYQAGTGNLNVDARL